MIRRPLPLSRRSLSAEEDHWARGLAWAALTARTWSVVSGLLTGLLVALVGCDSGVSELEGVVSSRLRGQQEVVLEGGEPRPLFLGPKPEVLLCVEALEAADTSQWMARLWLDAPGVEPGGAAARSPDLSDFRSPDRRLQNALCFALGEEQQVALAQPGDFSLCGEVVDGFDGRHTQLPCHSLVRDPSLEPWTEAREELMTAVGTHVGGPIAELVSAVDEVGSALASSFPILTVRAELINVHYLLADGRPESVEHAERRIDELPRWVDHPAAGIWSAQLAQQRMRVALARGNHLLAWQELGEAERRYRLSASSNWVSIAMQRADLLGRGGAVEEGARGLERVLAECSEVVCAENLMPSARGLLGWLLAIDPLTTEERLAQAAEWLDQSQQGIDQREVPIEAANVAVNQALLERRRGQQIEPILSHARELVVDLPSSRRRDQVLQWVELLEAEELLGAGRWKEAVDRCALLTIQAVTTRLEARAWSCQGQGERLLGRLDSASAAFAQALALHEESPSRSLGFSLSLGISQRADDFYRAARLAIEAQEPELAWQTLDRLDRLAHLETEHCEADDLSELRRERERLLAQRGGLEEPSSSRRREQSAGIYERIQARLQELTRRESSCTDGVELMSSSADLRALPLPDEILVLARNRAGSVRLQGRVQLDREELSRRIAWARTKLEEGAVDEERWREQLSELARVLVPEDIPDEETAAGKAVGYALYGPLQGVPLAALPVDGSNGERWLGEVARLYVVPATVIAEADLPRAGSAGMVEDQQVRERVFVVDPLENLPAGGVLRDFYRRTFPEALILAGSGASAGAVQLALEGARWAHLDVHASYDPAYPELSGLELADGEVEIAELVGWRVEAELVNLSGCETGRWPVTADGGDYGLAGLFARRGAGWVVATRVDLPDEVAATFNRAFYEALEAKSSLGSSTQSLVPEAFSVALLELKEKHSVASWSNLFLLRGKEAGSRLPGK